MIARSVTRSRNVRNAIFLHAHGLIKMLCKILQISYEVRSMHTSYDVCKGRMMYAHDNYEYQVLLS